MIFRSAPDQLPIGRANSFGYKSGFGPAEIAREKDPESYPNLVWMRGFEPARTWMIGNSPKSDINPALDVGLNASAIYGIGFSVVCTGARVSVRFGYPPASVLDLFRKDT